MDVHDESGSFVEGLLVVGEVGLVGRSDLPQGDAAGGHDLRQPKRSADLDQLSAGDDRLAALGQPLFVNASVQASATDGTWTYAQDREWHEAGDGKAADGDALGQPTAEHLYDRAVDPGENVNLISREPEQADRMRTLLRDHLAAGGTGIAEADVWIDPAIADRLRAMGYLR